MNLDNSGWLSVEGVQIAIDDKLGILVYKDENTNVQSFPVAKVFAASFIYLTKWEEFKAKVYAIYQIIKA